MSHPASELIFLYLGLGVIVEGSWTVARNRAGYLRDHRVALPLHFLFWWVTLIASPKMVAQGFLEIVSNIYWWIKLKERRERVAYSIRQKRLERRVTHLEEAANSIADTLKYRTEEIRAKDRAAVDRLQEKARRLVERSVHLEQRIADAHPVVTPSGRKERT